MIGFDSKYNKTNESLTLKSVWSTFAFYKEKIYWKYIKSTLKILLKM